MATASAAVGKSKQIGAFILTGGNRSMESPKLSIGFGPRVMSRRFRKNIRVKCLHRRRDVKVSTISACDDWEETKAKWIFITVFPYQKRSKTISFILR